MSDDSVAVRFFVFRDKIRCTGKGDLSNIFFNLLFRHADPVIFYGERLCLFVHRNLNAVFFIRCRSLAKLDQFFKLCNGVNAVGNDFSEENILVGIEPFFDDGHHVFA